MLPTITNEIIESLEKCTIASATLKSIKVMEWPRGLKNLTCLSDTILMTRDELEALAKAEAKKSTGITETKVKVRIIDLRWFWQGKKNFFAFTRMLILDKLPIGFYSSKFIFFISKQLFSEA